MLVVGKIAGRSAAWLARLPWEQEVGRSNRLAPTKIFNKIIYLTNILNCAINWHR